MDEFREAFESLGPIEYSALPHTDGLPAYIQQAFDHAELLVNSVPFHQDHNDSTHHPVVSSSKKATKASETLAFTPHIDGTAPRNEELQKQWGKPLKVSAKENPLKVNVYKMAAQDRHGAWFARRSVHQGVGFDRFKNAMQKEFEVSLKVKEGPGSGAIRGIAGDRKVEKQVVDGRGTLEVWQLSARFGPVTPREFVALLLHSEDALSKTPELQGSSKHAPRHYINISRPVHYDGIENRAGLVKGEYESVELIREIPRHPDEDGEDGPDTNLVEWIMITRSDPGGGIPKFMVERGTPGSIVSDVAKFLDWACKHDEIPSVEEEEAATANEKTDLPKDHEAEPVSPIATHQQLAKERAASVVQPDQTPDHEVTHPVDSQGTGWFSTIGNAVENTVSGYLPYFTHRPQRDPDEISTASSSDASSFASATQFNTAEERRGPAPKLDGDDVSVTSSTPSRLPTSHVTLSAENLAREISEPQNTHERELLKLTARRAALDDKIAKAHEDDEARAKELADKDEKDRTKGLERLERDKHKQEEKFRKEIDKLEERQKKEAKKVEERRRKMVQKDAINRAQREKNEWRERCEQLTKANALLTAQVESLQRENTGLVAKMGSGESGMDAVRKVREEARHHHGRKRASSRGSTASAQSALHKTPKEAEIVATVDAAAATVDAAKANHGSLP